MHPKFLKKESEAKLKGAEAAPEKSEIHKKAEK